MTEVDAHEVTPDRVAVRRTTDPREAEALARYLAQHGVVNPVEFSEIDDDGLDETLCAGDFQRAVFFNLDALLTGVWKGHGRIDRWQAAGVEIEFAEPPGIDPSATQGILLEMVASLATWRQRQRRRQIIAAVVLSAVALICLALLFLFVPPAS